MIRSARASTVRASSSLKKVNATSATISSPTVIAVLFLSADIGVLRLVVGGRVLRGHDRRLDVLGAARAGTGVLVEGAQGHLHRRLALVPGLVGRVSLQRAGGVVDHLLDGGHAAVVGTLEKVGTPHAGLLEGLLDAGLHDVALAVDDLEV